LCAALNNAEQLHSTEAKKQRPGRTGVGRGRTCPLKFRGRRSEGHTAEVRNCVQVVMMLRVTLCLTVIKFTLKQRMASPRYKTALTAGMLNLRVSFKMSSSRRAGCVGGAGTTGERVQGRRWTRRGCQWLRRWVGLKRTDARARLGNKRHATLNRRLFAFFQDSS